MKSEPGTYALVLYAHKCDSAQIGRWGRLDIRPGHDVDVGSAFGPGGLSARVARHCRKGGAKHWHIDYLREFAVPVSVWYSHSTRRAEHNWAKALSETEGAEPVKGFGCTDCQCASHLFYFDHAPDPAGFSKAVNDDTVRSCACGQIG